jgi:hypothetical protein
MDEGGMIVVLGGNEFIDCESILAAKGEPVLSVRAAPLTVTIRTPKAWPPLQGLTVVANEVPPHQEGVRVVRDDVSVCVVFHDFPMLFAVSERPDRVLLRVDLRAIGINVFDDAQGLHIGENFFRGNRISNAATAISLG